MKAKTNNNLILGLTSNLARISLISTGIVLVCCGFVISNAQSNPQKVFVENRANIIVPNDSRQDNNQAVAQDYIIKNPIITSSSSIAVSSIAIIPEIPKPIPNPTINQISILGYNVNINNSQQNTPQIQELQQELQQYALAGGGSWLKDQLYINNPIEVVQFVIKHPDLTKYALGNLIRTGGQQASLQSALIPLILFILLISSIANLVNKKLTYNTK